MESASAIVSLVLRLVLLLLVVSFTVETSKGDAVPTKIAKFLGLLVSIVPIIGLIMFVVARGKKSGFGERCAAMAVAGVIVYLVTRAA
jgi:hypothetical protein